MNKQQQAQLETLVTEGTQLAAEERANRERMDALAHRVENLEWVTEAVDWLFADLPAPDVGAEEVGHDLP